MANKVVIAREQMESNLKDIDGHFQLKVGTVREREKIRTGEIGALGIYEDVDATWWRVYLDDQDLDMPFIDTLKKQDAIDFLRMLRDEAQTAIDTLEAM